MRLPFKGRSIDLKTFGDINWEDMEHENQVNMSKIILDVTAEDVAQCTDELPVITYLAGYCCHVVHKKLKCDVCKEVITCTSSADTLPDQHIYIQGISRGSLLYPDDVTVNIVVQNYVIINKLIHHHVFAKSINQRKLATALTLNALEDDSVTYSADSWMECHNIEKIKHMIVWASSNSLLNNLCAKENNGIACAKPHGKKRKLETLTK